MPAIYCATLTKGLRRNSRLATAISGYTYTNSELMIARLIDEVSWLAWTKTKDATHNRNQPKRLLHIMTEQPDETSKIRGFNSPEEYELERARILREVEYGN